MKKVVGMFLITSVMVLAGCMSKTTSPDTIQTTTGDVTSGAVIAPTMTGSAHKEVNLKTSTVKWVGKKIGGQHSGTVKIKSGSVDFVDGKLIAGSFVIDMTTITVDDKTEAVRKHLESDDFFSVEKYPEAMLKITKVDPATAANGYDITADLTIKGITKPIHFVATIDLTTWVAHAPIVIDRTLRDIKFRSLKFFSDVADKAIDDDISFEVALNLK